MTNKKKPATRTFVPVANEELAKAMRDIAFSGSWGTHDDRRFKRQRTRANSKGKAIRDSRDV